MKNPKNFQLFKLIQNRPQIIKINFPGIFVTMTVDNRGQDDEEVGQPQLQRQNSKGEIKESDGSNLQATPLEKVRHK